MSAVPQVYITIIEGDEVKKRNLTADLTVSEEHINDYLVDAPGKTAYWMSLFEAQKTRVQKQKVALERYASELATKLRKEANADSVRVSDKAIEDLIKSDEDYQVLEDDLLDMTEQMNMLKAAVEAVREMRSTLISLSANMRTEYSPIKIGKKTEQTTNKLTDKLRKLQK